MEVGDSSDVVAVQVQVRQPHHFAELRDICVIQIYESFQKNRWLKPTNHFWWLEIWFKKLFVTIDGAESRAIQVQLLFVYTWHIDTIHTRAPIYSLLRKNSRKSVVSVTFRITTHSLPIIPLLDTSIRYFTTGPWSNAYEQGTGTASLHSP